MIHTTCILFIRSLSNDGLPRPQTLGFSNKTMVFPNRGILMLHLVLFTDIYGYIGALFNYIEGLLIHVPWKRIISIDL